MESRSDLSVKLMEQTANATKEVVNVPLDAAAAAVPGTEGRQEYDALPQFRDLYPCAACFCTTASCYVSVVSEVSIIIAFTIFLVC